MEKFKKIIGYIILFLTLNGIFIGCGALCGNLLLMIKILFWVELIMVIIYGLISFAYFLIDDNTYI